MLWGDIIQSLATRAAAEFHAWARATTYARRTGSHIIDCKGTIAIGASYVLFSYVWLKHLV